MSRIIYRTHFSCKTKVAISVHKKQLVDIRDQATYEDLYAISHDVTEMGVSYNRTKQITKGCECTPSICYI